MKYVKIISVCMLILSLFECNGRSKGNEDLILALGLSRLTNDSSNSTAIDASSGGIAILNHSVRLIIPANALQENETISYRKITNLPSEKNQVVPVQVGYEFAPHGLQFNEPAILEVCYDHSDLHQKGFDEKTVQIHYWDTKTQEYISMGGLVDTAAHCVRSSIYHFSSYLLTAQITSVGDNPPLIGGATFFPSTPIAGLPTYVRSNITDFDNGGSIAGVLFYFRTAGSSAAFQAIEMLPETEDASGNFYGVSLPDYAITSAGLEYYIKAYDSLNKSSTLPANAPITFSTKTTDSPDPVSPIRFNATIGNMAAGFSRDLTIQVKGASSPTYFPVIPSSFGFPGTSTASGSVSKASLTSIRYTAKKIGISSFDATYGTLSVSQNINIFPGTLSTIKWLDENGVFVPNELIVMKQGEVKQFDVQGFDAYNNFVIVYPEFIVDGSFGSFGTGPNVGKFTAGPVAPGESAEGKIVASVGTKTAVRFVKVIEPTYIYATFQNNTGKGGRLGLNVFDASQPTVKIGFVSDFLNWPAGPKLVGVVEGTGALMVFPGQTINFQAEHMQFTLPLTPMEGVSCTTSIPSITITEGMGRVDVTVVCNSVE